MSDVDRALAPVEPVLAAFVTARRWFRSKARAVAGCALVDAIPLPIEPAAAAGEPAWLGVVQVSYEAGPPEEYVLPLVVAAPERAAEARLARPHTVVASTPEGGAILDGLSEPQVLRALLEAIGRGTTVDDRHGAVLRFRRVGDGPERTDAAPRPITAEQSNTSIVFGDSFILKVIRKLDEGVSADLEMGEFLTTAGYAYAPSVAGAIDLARDGGEPATVAILHRFVPNRGDAWSFFLERLARRLDGASADDRADADAALFRTLAARVGQMHLALASRPDVPSFAPEPLARDERSKLADALRASMQAAFATLTTNAMALPAAVVERASALRSRQADFEARLARFVDHETGAQKTRVHGDLHLGQVLVSGDDFVLIDFEGEPARSIEERKAKRSPLVDVAGILRSLHYASVSAARAHAGSEAEATRRAEGWYREASRAFLDAWLATVKGASFQPSDERDSRRTLDFFVLEKCVYELHYELNNRPDWAFIPLAGLSQLLESADAA